MLILMKYKNALIVNNYNDLLLIENEFGKESKQYQISLLNYFTT